MKTNNLINEKSPYLLQHAHNPVNWYTWNDEALSKALDEDKLILLSIGYSTCHWCHVMEKESFEDFEVARVLNKSFVSIKVDREERPDIDSIYMKVCQILTGSGGWPLNVILTPDKLPIYSFTYLPKNTRGRYMGFIEVLEKINDLWTNDRENIIKTGNDISNAVSSSIKIKDDLSEDVVKNTIDSYKESYDSVYGGFGRAPKFPSPHNLMFLLRNYYLIKDNELLDMVEHTLISMYKGGIYDHIGFGFSRYSVDEQWLVPHFEKMLYDNAMLAISYTEAFQITKKDIYKKVANEIFEYILRDMTSVEGGFYSAEDADSEGVEGKFYVFDKEEVLDILNEEICDKYDITGSGNFEGKNIFNLIGEELNDLLTEEERLKLFDYREKRIHPHKDDKILTSWNALMISALSYGGRVFNEEKYIIASKRAVSFIFDKLMKNGRLFARYREGESLHKGYLDDYAFLVNGLIELYESTFKFEYLEKAIMLNDVMLDLFYDKENGGFYLTGNDAEELLYRPKDGYDGAIPSGNSIALMSLIKLSRITGEEYLIKYVDETIKYFAEEIKMYSRGYSAMLSAYLMNNSPTREVIIVADGLDKIKELRDIINSKFSPFTTVLFKDEESTKHIPLLENYKNIGEYFTVYICENFKCSNPLTSLEEVKKYI